MAMPAAQVLADDVFTGVDVQYPDDANALPDGSEVDGRETLRALDEIADYVVVGTGAAGAAAAVVLAERGFSVAMIEEGEWVRTREFGVDFWPAMKRMIRGRGTSIISGRAFVALMQGRCVGGSTTINSAIAWRAPEQVIDSWSREFGLGDDVTNDALAPHFDALERELQVNPVSDESLGENSGLFGIAAGNLGLESHRIQRYDRGCRGSAGCLTGCRTAKKLSMNVSYVPRTLKAGGRIFTSARVERIEFRGGRAVAVTATMAGRHGPVALRIRARRGVVVGASTVQTPNILRRSGLRARAIGRHFQAHPGVSMMGLLDRPVAMDYGAAQGYNSLALLESDRIKLESLTLPPELAVSRLPGFGDALLGRLKNYPNMATWAVVIRSESEGRVDEALGADRVRFSMNARDMGRARKGLKTLTEMLFSVGAREIYPGVHGMPPVLTSPDQIALWDDASLDPRAYTMIASHLFGAARMGRDPRKSVVGTDFATHEAEGLYVVDSSVFPTNLGVNPQHTIMAMARLAATRITERPLLAI